MPAGVAAHLMVAHAARAKHRRLLKTHYLLQGAGEMDPDMPCSAASPAHLAECFLHAQEVSLLVEVAGSLSGDQHLEQVGHKPQEDAQKGLQAGDVSAIMVAEASAYSVGRQDGTSQLCRACSGGSCTLSAGWVQPMSSSTAQAVRLDEQLLWQQHVPLCLGGEHVT